MTQRRKGLGDDGAIAASPIERALAAFWIPAFAGMTVNNAKETG